MILYKYIQMGALEKVLESNAIGFRQPHLFNDPFEVTAAYPRPDSGNRLEEFVGSMRIDMKQQMLVKNHAILSLTRSPTNPLMWAHYGEFHRGWVVGINVDQEIFTSHARNTLPVQYGAVIYTESKPTGHFLDLATATANGQPFHPDGQVQFLPHHFEKLQRAFLYKPADWAYEEEVRIVKCCKGISSSEFNEYDAGTFKVVDAGGPLYLLQLPQGSIVSVQAGLRNTSLAGEAGERIRSLAPNAKLYRSWIDDKTWSIQMSEVG